MNNNYLHQSLDINRVIYSDPATIVFWNDGTKTVVRAIRGDKYNPEMGLAMAICKKYMGNTRDYYETFLKWLPKENKPMGNHIDDYIYEHIPYNGYDNSDEDEYNRMNSVCRLGDSLTLKDILGRDNKVLRL